MNQKVKTRASQKINEMRYLTRELKRLWNLKGAVIPFVIGALVVDNRGLVLGLKE